MGVNSTGRSPLRCSEGATCIPRIHLRHSMFPYTTVDISHFNSMSKILRDHKKLNLPSFSNNLLEDFSISKYFKNCFDNDGKETSCCVQQHRFCPHHVPANFITFHFRAPGRNHIVSAPFEAMEFPCLVNEHPCLVNEHRDSSCPLQFCLGHKASTHTGTGTGTSKGTHFFFCPIMLSLCSLSLL